MMYCKTISEYNGRHLYGIDAISYDNSQFNIVMSFENVTDIWCVLCQLVKWVNILNVPPEKFYDFLSALTGVPCGANANLGQYEGERQNAAPKIELEWYTYNTYDECPPVRDRLIKSIPDKLDKSAMDRICRVLNLKDGFVCFQEDR